MEDYIKKYPDTDYTLDLKFKLDLNSKSVSC